MKRIVAFFLTMCLLTGCAGKQPSGEDLMENVKPTEQSKELIVIGQDEPDAFDYKTDEPWENTLVADFGLHLFRQCMEEGENILISHISVLAALGMTANGAEGNTLSQMESVLGQSRNALNNWYRYSQTAHYDCLRIANGIWFKNDPNLAVEESFLQTNADVYGAGIYKTPFDETTLKDINSFVEEHTDGMVKDILEEIPKEAVLYLVNALAFDGQWRERYKENQVQPAIFTTEAGEEQEMELMYSEENHYLEHDLATGFLKPYQYYGMDDRYYFAALLPKEGITVAELAESLDGKGLQSLLANRQPVTVNAAIPKFEAEFNAELSEALKEMGMTDAFDASAADFTAMATCPDGNIYISKVIHKTFISVAEKGSKAGAATVVEAARECALEREVKRVTLDRPFLYMIVDIETNTPVFIGAQMDMA